MPDLANYIDAHVHVWTYDFVRYPFAQGITPAHMKPAAFTPDDFWSFAWPSGVTQVVFVQMDCYGTNNSYMVAVLQSFYRYRGIALVDPLGAAPDAQMRELARWRVRGFRIYPPEHPSADWLSGEGFAKMFRCGAEENLAMCLLVNPQDLGGVARECERFPETPVVIDHMARIGRDGPILESDVDALCALARYPRVKVKVSAFYALGEKTPPHLDLAPMIKRLVEAFGPERLMWASDCPFQTANETYEDSISLVRDHLHFLSPSDKEWMLRRCAEGTFFR